MTNSPIITPDKKIVPLNPNQTTETRIGRTGENVVIQFSSPTVAVKLIPLEALEMAGLLIKHAAAFVIAPKPSGIVPGNDEKKIELPD